jgi:hypothetical protein
MVRLALARVRSKDLRLTVRIAVICQLYGKRWIEVFDAGESREPARSAGKLATKFEWRPYSLKLACRIQDSSSSKVFLAE